jgi:hypothetical protein
MDFSRFFYLIKMNIQQANRTESKIRLGLIGAAGSGKTYSALLIAFGLCESWEKIAVIDTESKSAHLYAHLGSYSIISLDKPYSPERFNQALNLLEKADFEVIIFDSLSASWNGEGGLLDIHSSLSGNSFQAWSKLKPRYNRFIKGMLDSPAHVISTLRTKVEYAVIEKNGKQVPTKMGKKPVGPEDFDYELTLAFHLNHNNEAHCTKDRTGLFANSPAFIPSDKTGRRIKKWCALSPTENDVLQQINDAQTEDELKSIYENSGDYKKSLQFKFKEKWNSIIIQNETSNRTTDNN